MNVPARLKQQLGCNKYILKDVMCCLKKECSNLCHENVLSTNFLYVLRLSHLLQIDLGGGKIKLIQVKNHT